MLTRVVKFMKLLIDHDTIHDSARLKSLLNTPGIIVGFAHGHTVGGIVLTCICSTCKTLLQNTVLHISNQISQQQNRFPSNTILFSGFFEIWMFGYAENVPMRIIRFQFSNKQLGNPTRSV